MSITAAMVKKLRERTGSGMMECKKALLAANGDLELAIEQMRKSGMAKADKKAGRTAAEGRIGVKVSEDGKSVAMVEVNSETDFVAKGDDFGDFVDALTDKVLNPDVDSVDQLLQMTLPDDCTIDEKRRELIAKLGENITVRRFARFTTQEGGAACYLHGSRIGVIVELSKPDPELGKDIAMHVAATNPVCIADTDVPQDMLEKEKEIFTAQAKESGKPDAIIEKMISGRIRKYLAEITLLGQAFVKDPDTTVAKLLDSKGASVLRFTRYEVGEGIEKKEENFAEEVMAQVRGD